MHFRSELEMGDGDGRWWAMELLLCPGSPTLWLGMCHSQIENTWHSYKNFITGWRESLSSTREQQKRCLPIKNVFLVWTPFLRLWGGTHCNQETLKRGEGFVDGFFNSQMQSRQGLSWAMRQTFSSGVMLTLKTLSDTRWTDTADLINMWLKRSPLVQNSWCFVGSEKVALLDWQFIETQTWTVVFTTPYWSHLSCPSWGRSTVEISRGCSGSRTAHPAKWFRTEHEILNKV